MKKILYAFVIIAVWYSGFTVISAQNGPSQKDPITQKDSEQNMNEMIQLLDKLQNDESMEKDISLPKNDAAKIQTPDDPMDIFRKPQEPSQPAKELVEKNVPENVFDTVNESVTSKPIAPVPGSLPGDKFSEDKKTELDDIEKNVDAMLKALEELESSGGLGAPDTVKEFVPPADRLTPSEKTTVGKSIEKTDDVVRLDPDGPDSHFQNGLVYWKSENLDSAIVEFQEVIRLAPENAHAYWNLGLLHDKLNQGPEAIANLKKAEGIYTKYNYPEFAEDARKRLNQFSEKYSPSLR
jgi:tetratricopeptide (TPR) repeat protein